MKRLFLTADQIYALAYILKAKYLDYYYISLASRSYDDQLWLSEITKQLVSLGILTEDFSGDTSLDSSVESLIKPIFFSAKESSIDINIFGEKEDNIGYRFHYLNNSITMTKTCDNGFEISSVVFDDINNIISSLIPARYLVESAKVDLLLDPDKVSRVFVIKNKEVDVKSEVATLVEMNEIVYDENADDELISLSRSDFEKKLYAILTEV